MCLFVQCWKSPVEIRQKLVPWFSVVLWVLFFKLSGLEICVFVLVCVESHHWVPGGMKLVFFVRVSGFAHFQQCVYLLRSTIVVCVFLMMQWCRIDWFNLIRLLWCYYWEGSDVASFFSVCGCPKSLLMSTVNCFFNWWLGLGRCRDHLYLLYLGTVVILLPPHFVCKLVIWFRSRFVPPGASEGLLDLIGCSSILYYMLYACLRCTERKGNLSTPWHMFRMVLLQCR